MTCQQCEWWCRNIKSRRYGVQRVRAGTREVFPAGVEAPVQYGPNVRALGVYLHQYQLVPVARSCELLEDLYDCHISEATRLALGAASGDRCGGDGRTDCGVAEGQSLAARR